VSSEASVIVDHLLSGLRKYEAWAKSFPALLTQARAVDGAPLGSVWQDELVDYWGPFDAIQKEMFELSDDLQSVLEDSGRIGVWKAIEKDLDPTHDAQIEFATAEGAFVDLPGSRSRIAHPVRRLEAWHRNFTRWVAGAIRHVKGMKDKI
jgi:hypothetical protein